MLGIPVLVVIALGIAFLLYRQIKGWQAFRLIAIIPYILSITAIAITFDYILRENGLLNSILRAIGLGSAARAWLGDASVAIYAIMGVVIWKEFGFGIILFLARMMSVDSQTIEAAIVDGATSLQTFWYVILPEMRNVILFYIVINVINMLSWMFNYIFVLTRGGPMQSTYVLEYYIYQTGIRYRQFGMSATLAVITLGIAVIFVIGQSIMRQRLAE
jgi:ABC-type sugar transport system permease subunit